MQKTSIKNKEVLIKELHLKIEEARVQIKIELHKFIELEKSLFLEFRKSIGINRDRLGVELQNTRKRIGEFEILYKTPFFAKVEYVVLEKNQTEYSVERERYIAKYPFSEAEISSWIAPVANLRFEELGKTSFKFEDGNLKDVDLNQKNNYVITEEKLVYFGNENKETGISVIYEDFFSNAKTEFSLGEIISKIEKEQYKIIQSDPLGELIISGPAGSGKTTICLHKVAYLMQSPETEHIFAEYKMIMFVQDVSSKEYFSSLLPKLGINNMQVLTYFEWLKQILNLPKISEVNAENIDENYLTYLEKKTEIIQIAKSKKFTNTNFLLQLANLYKENLQDNHLNLFLKNAHKSEYDYIDLSIMVQMIFEKDGYYKKEKYNKSVALDTIKTFTRKTKIEYSLVIVDEFQNYSQDQLDIIKLCRNKSGNSLTYIGDINQKNSFKPLSIKHDLDFFKYSKKVHLSKVYRNTKQILSYVKNLGYDISVPDEARSGDEVLELEILFEINQENMKVKLLEVLKATLEKLDDKFTIGILCDDLDLKKIIEKSLEREKEKIFKNLKIITKQESQGTEFNTAIVINGDFYKKNIESVKFAEMRKMVQKNNDYVGYTRAVEKLIVIKI